MEYYKNLDLADIVYFDEEGNQKTEEWRDVIGYEGLYQVSDLGRVKSLSRKIFLKKGYDIFKKEKIFKFNLNNSGYEHVRLSCNNKSIVRTIHQLVAECFLGHKPNKHKIIVDHINGIKTDNRLVNLQLITQRMNCSKDKKNKTSEYVGVSYSNQYQRYISIITINKNYIYLGSFKDEISASLMYQKALKNIHLYKNNNKEFKNELKKIIN